MMPPKLSISTHSTTSTTLFGSLLLPQLCIISTVLATLCGTTNNVSAYLVMASLNTYRASRVKNAVKRVDELHGDGVWFIARNMDFTDTQFQSIFQKLGGRHLTEDNPGQNHSYQTYVRVSGDKPFGCMCYNETGGTPGGTLLTDAQIDQQYASHGNKPIICLTRAYYGQWKQEVDRCLSNPKVSGICMEYLKSPLLNKPRGQHNGAPWNIEAVLKAGKKCYLLLHAGADGWSDADNRKIIEKLNRWVPNEMATDNVVLVYQNYDKRVRNSSDGVTEEWLGSSESVKSAIKQAKRMPNYSGNDLSFSFGQHGNVEGWTFSGGIADKVITHEGELLIVASPNSDPFITRRGLSIDGSKTTLVRILVKADQPGHMQIFWNVAGSGGPTPRRSKKATYRVANRWQELRFDMSDNSDWVGHKITLLRFDTTQRNSRAKTWIDYIVGSIRQ